MENSQMYFLTGHLYVIASFFPNDFFSKVCLLVMAIAAYIFYTMSIKREWKMKVLQDDLHYKRIELSILKALKIKWKK